MKVGDYVRTKLGTIGKLIEQNDNYVIISYKNDELFIKKEEIKSSPNIIDLIEVGDYVNGYKVLFIDNFGEKNIKCINNEEERECFYNEDIKSILTKEQFEAIQYEVK